MANKEKATKKNKKGPKKDHKKVKKKRDREAAMGWWSTGAGDNWVTKSLSGYT